MILSFRLKLHIKLAVFVPIVGCLFSYSCTDYIPPVSQTTGVEFEGSLQVTLDWDSVDNADSYNVYVSDFPKAFTEGEKISNAAKPFTITDLELGKTYYFAVAAVNGLEEFKKSEEISYAPDEKIAWLHLKFPKSQVASPGTGKVTLAWDDVKDATSYNIYWSDKPGVTKKNGTKIANVKSPHTITGLQSGITYYFVVTAVGKTGESIVSEEVSHTAP
jgi:fibronectin type 3 domain-containing protein